MVRTEWTTVAHHVFEVYGVRVARDSADPKKTGVQIVVVLTTGRRESDESETLVRRTKTRTRFRSGILRIRGHHTQLPVPTLPGASMESAGKVVASHRVL